MVSHGVLPIPPRAYARGYADGFVAAAVRRWMVSQGVLSIPPRAYARGFVAAAVRGWMVSHGVFTGPPRAHARGYALDKVPRGRDKMAWCRNPPRPNRPSHLSFRCMTLIRLAWADRGAGRISGRLRDQAQQHSGRAGVPSRGRGDAEQRLLARPFPAGKSRATRSSCTAIFTTASSRRRRNSPPFSGRASTRIARPNFSTSRATRPGSGWRRAARSSSPSAGARPASSPRRG